MEKKEYFDALPRDIKRKIMTDYLFKDVFSEKRFKEFIDNGEAMDPDFLYDLSFGLKPRQFWPTEEDCFIYESFEAVTEMYFIMRGRWAFAKEITNVDAHTKDQLSKNLLSIRGKHYLVLKDYHQPTYIGEYYILTASLSRYCYIARENVDTYALTRQFLGEIFEKYP